MNTPRFIVFDCDGTLVDSQFMIAEAMSRAFAAHGLDPLPRSAVRRVVGLHLDEAIMVLLEDGDPELAARVAETYREAFFTIRETEKVHEPLFEGTKEVLDALRRVGHHMGMATGKSRRGVDAVLAQHGLEPYFDIIKSADDGPGKPDPQILTDAMAQIGADPDETVVVGDTIFDIELAKNAGTHAVGVKWGYHDPEELMAAGAISVIDRFDALHRVLNEIWPG